MGSPSRVTLKALANVSPGFALKPWVQKRPSRLVATLKGLRLGEIKFVLPGLPKRNPGLTLANAFSVIPLIFGVNAQR